jgi:hypothetical protein
MTLPRALTCSNLKAALLKLAATEDEQNFLHPEHLLHCLTQADVQGWQIRLERLPWTQRVADRNFLLEGLEVM